MKKFFLICFLSVIVGGSILTTSEPAMALVRSDCDQAKAFVKKYWGHHKPLGHKPSKATLKAWASWRVDQYKKRFQQACEVMVPKIDVSGSDFLQSAPMAIPPMSVTPPAEIIPEAQQLTTMLAYQTPPEVPLYDNTPPTTDDGFPPNPGFPGWFSGGGWLGNPGTPSKPGCEKNTPNCPDGGNNPPPPVTPVPEPNFGLLSLAFALIGGAFVIRK